MRLNAGISTVLAVALCVGLTSTAKALESKKNEIHKLSGLEMLTAKDTPLKKGDKIAFFGDSVTMQGGYIKTIAAALQEGQYTKALDVKLLQHGLDGGRVPTVLEGKGPWGDLGGTMESLIEKEKPDVVVIYLGINDVWHGEKGTTKPDFEAGLKAMIALCRKAGATVMLCTPSVIGEEMTDANRLTKTLGEYSEIIRKLAKEEKTGLCDIHTAFVEELKKVNFENKHAGNLTYDGVHMNDKGNALLADVISNAMVETLKTRQKNGTSPAEKLGESEKSGTN